MNIIETENLSYKYDESHFALSDLSIGFEKGKITTILGNLKLCSRKSVGFENTSSGVPSVSNLP